MNGKKWIKSELQKPPGAAPVWVWDGIGVSIDNYYESDEGELYPTQTVEGRVVYIESSGWMHHRQCGVIAWMEMDVPYAPSMEEVG